MYGTKSYYIIRLLYHPIKLPFGVEALEAILIYVKFLLKVLFEKLYDNFIPPLETQSLLFKLSKGVRVTLCRGKGNLFIIDCIVEHMTHTHLQMHRK